MKNDRQSVSYHNQATSEQSHMNPWYRDPEVIAGFLFDFVVLFIIVSVTLLVARS